MGISTAIPKLYVMGSKKTPVPRQKGKRLKWRDKLSPVCKQRYREAPLMFPKANQPNSSGLNRYRPKLSTVNRALDRTLSRGRRCATIPGSAMVFHGWTSGMNTTFGLLPRLLKKIENLLDAFASRVRFGKSMAGKSPSSCTTRYQDFVGGMNLNTR